MKSTIDALGRRIDLNLLVVFDAIYRSRNLTAAGRRLGLSQPAMSHALGRLRSTFKDPLFVRLPRGLEPTPLADEVAPALMEGLSVIRGSLERKTFDAAKSTRIFKIGMGDIAEVVHLPQLAGAVGDSAPGVQLHTVGIPGPRLTEALGDGAVDIATGDFELGAGCRVVPLYEAEYACVVRTDHPDIGSRVTLAQFKNARHILVKPPGASQHGEVVERSLAARPVRARIAVQVSHYHGVYALITNTDLIAIVPGRLAVAMKQLGNVKLMPPPVALPKIRVSLYWHERFHRDAGNAWLRDIYLRLFQHSKN
ncbi:MAG: LysR family transcriptional regulator [Burkholderiales bacterium]